jgi:hypothetical protein
VINLALSEDFFLIVNKSSNNWDCVSYADTGELGALQAAGYQEEIAENKKTESLDKLPAPQETYNPIVNKGRFFLDSE